MNTKLLLELFRIPAQSGFEGKVQDFIVAFLKKHKIDYKMDSAGNIFNISHEDRPILSAHMDTVQDNMDVLFSKYCYIGNGLLRGYGVIGGDDKCGIYIILDLLENNPKADFNFVFSTEEEVGGIGIREFTKTQDLSKISYGLVLDRRGNSDILCTNNDYGNKDFEEILSLLGEPFGYKPGTGTFSDADFLSDYFSCANLSVGYYNAHTKNEYVNLKELQNTINFVNLIVTNIHTKFELPVKKYNYFRGGSSIYDELYDDSYYDSYGNSYPYTSSEKQACDICLEFTEVSKLKTIKTICMSLCGKCLASVIEEIEDYYYSAMGE